jgi:hypothetical protein
MKNAALITLVLIYWALHHAAYTLGIVLLMALLVKFAWPTALEKEVDSAEEVTTSR